MRGRPRAPRKGHVMTRRRQRHLHVMLSDGEAAALGRLCEASVSTPSEAVRQMIVASDTAARAGGGIPVIVLDRASYARHVRCVRGLGTLLNQSTRSLNAIAKAVREHGVDELDLLEAMEEAGRLQEITLTGVSEVREAEAAIMGRPTVRGW